MCLTQNNVTIQNRYKSSVKVMVVYLVTSCVKTTELFISQIKVVKKPI